MIKLENLTPEVYYKQSRDFQFIGRLYDLVLNSVKTNSELIYSLPISDNSSDEFLDLMAMTLGFKAKHNYNVKQLRAICASLPKIMKNKGNVQAVLLACQALLNSEGITYPLDYEVSKDNLNLYLFIPQELTDINLLQDLLDYILPAGMLCNITREFRLHEQAQTEIGIEFEVAWGSKKSEKISTVFGSNSMPAYLDKATWLKHLGSAEPLSIISADGKKVDDITSGTIIDSTVFKKKKKSTGGNSNG